MSSDVAELVTPRWFSVPEYSFTAGPEVVDLAADVGYEPDGNQRQILDVLFAENERGLPVAFEVALWCARQNIKTSVMKMASLGWLYLPGYLPPGGRVVYTAHDWNPACADMFREMKELVEGSDWLSKRTKRIYEGNGEEEIRLRSGATMLFKTRTKSGGRAMAGDKLMFDEAFALQPTHTGSLIPILSTRPLAQIFYGSSPAKADSTVQHDLTRRGRSGKDPQLGYIEFAAPPPAEACELGEKCDHGRDTRGCGCDRPELWREANPATASGRITIEYIAKERRTLAPAEFARERMGWPDEPAEAEQEATPVDLEAWAELVDDDPAAAPERMPAMAVEVFDPKAADQPSTAVIAAAGKCIDGVVHVELVERRRGTAWLMDRFRKLSADHGPLSIALDPGGPAQRLVKPLREAGFNVVEMKIADVVKAVGDFLEDIDDGMVVHGPQTELDTAAAAARKKPLGERFTIRRRGPDDVDVTPLHAVMWARWLAVELDYDLDDSIY